MGNSLFDPNKARGLKQNKKGTPHDHYLTTVLIQWDGEKWTRECPHCKAISKVAPSDLDVLKMGGAKNKKCPNSSYRYYIAMSKRPL